jgi:hypothetical protein
VGLGLAGSWYILTSGNTLFLIELLSRSSPK